MSDSAGRVLTPDEACRSCGCEGFRLTDGLCDGCHESAASEVVPT